MTSMFILSTVDNDIHVLIIAQFGTACFVHTSRDIIILFSFLIYAVYNHLFCEQLWLILNVQYQQWVAL